jgi:acetyl-CoA acetyltransferase
MPSADIAIVGYAQSPIGIGTASEVQLLLPVVRDALAMAGLGYGEADFTCSGSCDYLTGGPFAFVFNLEAVRAWPPIEESHLEMDGAWALYEAWVRLAIGDIDTALVMSSGKSSSSRPEEVWTQQGDPYYLAPLGVDPLSLAGLQARALLDAGKATERDFAEAAVRSRQHAAGNPNAQPRGELSVAQALAADYVRAPLRAHDLAPFSDGAAAVVLARGDRARELCERPAWIRGIDHRVEPHLPGFRDLTTSASTTLAARKAGYDGGPVDLAELCAVATPQELILRDALGLPEGTLVNPSGGPLAGNPVIATGLIRVIEAASRIMDGSARRALAHAAGGQLLQQNLVCLLEDSND